MPEPTLHSDRGPVVDLAKMDVSVLLSLLIGAARDAFFKAFHLCGGERRPFGARVFFVANGGVNALARQPDATGRTISFYAGMVVMLLEACLRLPHGCNQGPASPCTRATDS